jgi:hypothetical protein
MGMDGRACFENDFEIYGNTGPLIAPLAHTDVLHRAQLCCFRFSLVCSLLASLTRFSAPSAPMSAPFTCILCLVIEKVKS